MNNQHHIISRNESNSQNPLIEAAKPIFMLVGTMQQTISQLSTDGLIHKFSLLIEQFEENSEQYGAKHDAIQAAKYCLCTFVDEQAVRAGWADENWSKRSLLVSFYDETWGGERFFEMLDKLKQQPEKNHVLLEFIYLCLQFGYKGKYQVLNSGDLEIEKIKRDLVPLLQIGVFDSAAILGGARTHAVTQSKKKQPWSIPLWVVGIFSSLILGAAYFTFQWSLAGKFNEASTQINSITLPQKAAVTHTEKVTRLAPLLEQEIKRQLVSVADHADRSVVTILGDGLFESGSADIQDQYIPVLSAVGQALNSAEGQIVVTGYTDDSPIHSLAFPSNWHLSQGRADAVKEILNKYVTNGVNRIRAEGRGSTNPVAPNDTPDNKAKNRRVEITLFTTGAGPKLGTSTEVSTSDTQP